MRAVLMHVEVDAELLRKLASWLAPGGWLRRQIHRLGLVDAGADVDILGPFTPLAEFYRLSMAAIGPAAVDAGALTAEQTTALVERPAQPDCLGCAFVHVGVWGCRPA